jgi:hypothetical protein
VDGDDVRVAEPGQHAAFAREPLGEGRIGGQRLGKNLQSDQPFDFRLARLEHETHAALADEFQNFELRKTRSQCMRPNRLTLETRRPFLMI